MTTCPLGRAQTLTSSGVEQEQSDDEVLRRFDEVPARIRVRTAGFSEEEIAADVAAARAELPD